MQEATQVKHGGRTFASGSKHNENEHKNDKRKVPGLINLQPPPPPRIEQGPSKSAHFVYSTRRLYPGPSERHLQDYPLNITLKAKTTPSVTPRLLARLPTFNPFKPSKPFNPRNVHFEGPSVNPFQAVACPSFRGAPLPSPMPSAPAAFPRARARPQFELNPGGPLRPPGKPRSRENKRP